MFGDRVSLRPRTTREYLPNVFGKQLYELLVEHLAAFGGASACEPARVGVRKTFSLRARQRLLTDQHALPFVTLPRAAEAQHDGR